MTFTRGLQKRASKLKKEKLLKTIFPSIPLTTTPDIFPAIRNGEMDFYYKGGLLFRYDAKGFSTHREYAAIIKSPDEYVTESDLSNRKRVTLALDFASNLDEIKKNCESHSGVEALGVSELYHRHNCFSDSNIIVLDIEIAIGGSRDRIDILLFKKDTGELKFVEAKHFSNSHLWSISTPKICGQIQRYNGAITKNKGDIRTAYQCYLKDLNNFFGLKLPTVITKIHEKTKLYIFGFDNDQKNGRLAQNIINSRHFKNIEIYACGNPAQANIQSLWN